MKFGFTTHARQTWAIAAMSFGAIAKSAACVVAVAAAILVVLLMPAVVGIKGVSILPGTAQVLSVLTSPVADNARLPWVLIPLLIIFYAGELVWRERDAGLNDITDAAPIPEWILFLGKFLGLSLVLVAWTALVAMTGVLGQMRMGYFHPEIGLYVKLLFGLQLFDYVLFALLVFVVHAVVNQKQIGYLVALIAYGVVAFPSSFGLEHHLLIYGSGPKWTYSDMRGFGSSLAPWIWFKLYWTAWALLLAVAGRLLWVRGAERSFLSRLRMTRARFTGVTMSVAAMGLVLIVALGGFIFYNTNVVNRYRTTSGEMEQRAEYERRYGKYAGFTQPVLTSTSLRVEIYPDRHASEVRGIYILANTGSAAIDSIHLSTASAVETRDVSVDRPASAVLTDDELGYRIYKLEAPLQPGDSLHLSFSVRFAPRGFGNDGVDAAIVGNGSYFTNRDWLPAIGYQRNREIAGAGVRSQHGLAHRPAAPPVGNVPSRRIRVGGDPIHFDAIVGTNPDQVAVAPGTLRRTWIESGRRYFHYVTDVPVNNEYAVFSARYALHEEQWTGSGRTVAIQIFHDPRHTANLQRMVRAVRASLSYHTERFSAYPFSYIRLIEDPTRKLGVQTQAATVAYGEGFSLLNPGTAPLEMEAVFSVIAHAVARGWWGMQVAPAAVAGSGLLDVGLETYSAMRVVEETLGREHLRRYVRSLQEGIGGPRARAAAPLLRATDALAFSRKAPFALYAMHEYIGKDRIDDALRELVKKYGSGTPPLPTSGDFYRELQAVTPDSYRSLLQDLFEKNTFWKMEIEKAAAEQASSGAWQVNLDVRARKTVIDEAGVETDVPMDDWVQVGVFGEDEKPIYLQMHRIRTGTQKITVTVPHKPGQAAIDPDHLIIDLLEPGDNLRPVTVGK